MNRSIKKIIGFISILILVNVIGNYIYARFDLTQDKRYTVSQATKDLIEPIDSPLVIDVFLEGTLPSEFRKLQTETKQLLAEFQSENKNIAFTFLNPLDGENDPIKVQEQLYSMGVTPAEVEIRDNGKVTVEQVYPWALASYAGKSVKIPLLKNTLGATSQERVNNSIQNLEYAFANGFQKLVSTKKKSVAILKGNSELDDTKLASFLKNIKGYYGIAPFVLDSVSINPERTLKQLLNYDLIVVAKPTEAFSEAEIYVLDQYIMNGGASLFLVDNAFQQMFPETGVPYLVQEDLGLNNLFFKYGLRISSKLVKDMYSAPIVLAQGSEDDSQYNSYPYFYYPLTASTNAHPIVTNLEAVRFSYASALELLESTNNKTVLLSSSPITGLVPYPAPLNFDVDIPHFLQTVNEGPNPEEFSAGEQPLAVLLEGTFTSALKNRVKPFKISDNQLAKDESVATKMIVISDGDVIANDMDKGRPLPTGFDKLTQTMYGNSDFLLNSVNYLLDENGLINIRTKEIAIPFLDQQKVITQRTRWQAINLLLPLGLLSIFGVVFSYIRKRKYQQ